MWLFRSVLVHSESHYDAFDLAFTAPFRGVELPPALKDAIWEWLAEAREGAGERVPGGFESLEELKKELEKRLAEQKERHDGGNYWVGTGGTSPFGHSGRNDQGIRIGGESRGRGAVQVAEERRWGAYRTDMTLSVRDFKVALALLRNLARDGREELDVDGTIARTARGGGEIELAFARERVNRVRLVLLMDVGGSMEPHAATVSRMFTAATEMKIFKTFDAYYFHNAPYRWLYRNYATYDRRLTADVVRDLTPEHRVIFVGDASMAPWELFNSGFGDTGPSGLDWIQRMGRKAPASAWLNPDPPRYWDHPTVRAIASAVPMFQLSVDGLRSAVRSLRAGGKGSRAAG